MTDARSAILARLRAAPTGVPLDRPAWRPPALGGQRLERFRAMLESVHAEVHMVTSENWPARLRALLAAKNVATLMHAPTTPHGARLAAAWAGDKSAPELTAYDAPVEQCKERLVHGTDAALTACRGGIAETGSLVLWPTAAEPRLMSLLPPVHVALIEAEAIVDSLADLMAAQGWAGGLPTNVVLVSGPSKTADIEQTLAYGVHGPKELIVLVIKRED